MARLRGIEVARSRGETSFCRAWETVSRHLWLRFIFRGLQSSLYTEVKPPSSRMSPLRETTGAVYRHRMVHGLIFVTQKSRAPCSCSVSICVLSGCGGNTKKAASKQDSLLDLVRPPLPSNTISFSSLPVFFPSSHLLFTPIFIFFRHPIGPWLRPLPAAPVAWLQRCLGKADCGIPGKPRRERRERGEVEAGSIQLSIFTPQ